MKNIKISFISFTILLIVYSIIASKNNIYKTIVDNTSIITKQEEKNIIKSSSILDNYFYV